VDRSVDLKWIAVADRAEEDQGLGNRKQQALAGAEEEQQTRSAALEIRVFGLFWH
jgi:hypothetical protein